MWGLPGPGIEPMTPALAGGFLTTAPPGKKGHGILSSRIYIPVPAIFILDLPLPFSFPLYKMGIVLSPSRECGEDVNKNTKHVDVCCGWEHALQMLFLIPVRVSPLSQTPSGAEGYESLCPQGNLARGSPPAFFRVHLLTPPHGSLKRGRQPRMHFV